MAADLNPEWLSCLPSSWSYGVTRDGRVFFINEEAKSTTWLHPVTGEAVITGHRKTPDLPTGWEEGYTFEGARCFINHNERKVTCKHPVTGVPSQDNCIFVVNEQPATKAPAAEKKERPTSTMSEASNYTGGSDYATHPSSPTTRLSRSSKKVHNFGKRSNSIKRNPNAPVVKNGWLYKQDSTGMKMWKKRWFVLSDMCLFYYRDEKEEGILGSILLPSFHISMLSVDDHISRKYAFKATHPNMRTYYFSTDTAKDMESWMKVMTDASLVHSEPIRRLEKVKVDSRSPQEMNNMLNHRVLTRPEIQNNERNRETLRQEEKKQKAVDKQKEKDGRVSVQKDGERYTLQRDADNYALHKDAQRLALQKDGDRYMLQKDVEKFVLQKDGEKYAVHKEGEKYLLQKDGQKYTVHKDGDKYTLQREGEKYAPPKDGEKSLQKDARYPLGDKHVQQKDSEKPVPPPREGEKYGFQKEGAVERPLTKINSIKLQPAQAAAIAAAVSSSRQLQSAAGSAQYKPAQVNGSGERGGDRSPGDMNNTVPQRTTVPPQPAEPERTLSRTNSMQQLEQWVRTHRTRAPDDDTRSITSYQTLPRNMPSHRAQIVPRYPEGYRTLPRNMLRPDSICSVAGSVYDRALPPATAEKRRSIRDDTMWQLYEWQQRQAHSRIGYGTLPSPKTMGQIAESIPTSPSHGSLAGYHTFSPNRPLNPDSRSEVSSPVFRGDVTIERRHRPHPSKYSYPAERRPVPPAQSITAQSLQGKTPEELTLLLIKLRRQQAELNSLREHTLAQLMQLNLDAANPKSEILSHHLQRNLMYLDSQMSPEEYRENTYIYRPEELDIDAKLSQLCEQDKVVRTQEEKLQQLHREKHTLETALLSASQEIEMSSENPAAVQSVIQQRDVLQSGLLSTCREVSRVNAELERSWREYDRMEADVTMAKTNLLEQLEALGSPQTEPPSQKHVQIQKELWRIQDVMEALIKNKPKRNTEPSFPGANPLSNLHKSEGPDYRLYKSEPELTTVAEVDESNGEDKSEQTAEKETAGVNKGVVYPVGVVSPRTKSPMPESSTIASYVTLRKSKKPDPRTSQPQDRPRSAVEQMSSAIEVGRTRMSVEEQMERIRRHQQGALRERRREDGSLSRSLSFTKENTYYTLQARKKSPVISPDEQDDRRDMSPEKQRELTTKPTDAEENCKNTEDVESGNATLENKEKAPTSRTASIKEALLKSAGPKPVLNKNESEPKLVSPLEYRKTLAAQNSLQTAVMVRVDTEEDEEEDEEDDKPSSQEQDVSYGLTNSKHGTLMSVNSLSTPPQSPSSSSSPPPPPSPPQLTDGSHFMCV
ncbi:pleckstrin homology domain-containing family A member 5 isoform X25 [Labeo rohita]|uniref:pleckstrin homology domain-containing family A member 5 isoform X25 n=1 Tax=Labeo rohita TaxID=84645 RepID=UPI0021E21454|nr:pleckstrin homology domain-containing family A member 5 isoform X25 [Labeo rohita]